MTEPATVEANLLPLPSATTLRWDPEPLSFAPRPRCFCMPRVVARGGADAGLLHVIRSERGEALVAIRLDGAFVRWPVTPSAPVELLGRDFGNTPAHAVSGEGGKLLIASHGGHLGRWDAPASALGQQRIVAGRTVEAGVYSLAWRKTGSRGKMAEHDLVIEHLGGDRLEVKTPTAIVPMGTRFPVAAVADDGTLLLALAEHGAADGDAAGVDVLRVSPAGVETLGAAARPGGSSLEAILPRSDGGAWLVHHGRQLTVQRVDTSGTAVGTPWALPFADVLRGEQVVERWGDGFVICVQQHPLVLLVSDGVHTTRVEGAPPGAPAMSRYPSVVAAADGASFLVATSTEQGFQVLRAVLGPGDGDAGDRDPWAAERAARKTREERLAAARANPPPPRLPGRPVESADGDGPAHDKERLVGQARLRAILAAMWGVHSPGIEAGFRGNDETGMFVDHDGCGNHVAMAWGPEGLVAIAFDHDMNEEAGLPEKEWNPERHFERAPPILAPIIERAIKVSNRLASGAIWITAGDTPRWDELGEATERLAPFALPAAVALSRGEDAGPGFSPLSKEHGQLAMHLATLSSAGPHVVTAEEAAVLVTRPAALGSLPANPDGAGRAAKALASMGITWSGASDAADAAIASRTRAARDALGAPQVELLEATSRGDVGAVRALLAQGAGLECTAYEGLFTDREGTMAQLMGGPVTPLVVAAMRGHVDVVDVLLEAGARVDAGDGRPVPLALYFALSRGDAAMVEGLMPRAPALSADGAMHAHLMNRRPGPAGGNIDIIRMLLARGASRFNGAVRRNIVITAEAAGDEELAARFRDLT